jgi:hypothetical protein
MTNVFPSDDSITSKRRLRGTKLALSFDQYHLRSGYKRLFRSA